MRILDKSFIRQPKNYIIQSALAVIVLTIILYFVETLTHAAIVAALGSSTFIVFAMPRSTTARTRRLVGGHIVGLLSGSLCYYIFFTGALGRLVAGQEILVLFVYALAVGLAMFVMAITNTEHPPAAGTALGIVAHTWSLPVVVFILLAVISLSIIRKLLKGFLKNLF